MPQILNQSNPKHTVNLYTYISISGLILRLLVECRFMPGTVLSVSYLVKTPTLGPDVQAQGMFGVQLRIAKGR